MTFTMTEASFGPYPVLDIEGGATRVLIALCGATVLSWNVHGVELVDGYADEVEFAEQLGMRSAMMIPFSNRVDGGRYSFDGVEHDFNEGDADNTGATVLHGLLRQTDFTLAAIELGESSAVIHLVTRALRPGTFAGYPFSVDVSIDVEITETSIQVTIEGTNTGETAAPFASGWHPYFTIGTASVDELVLTVPADTRIVSDPDLIPLEGAAGRVPTAGEWDFREPRPIRDQALDVAFDDLSLAADGLAHSTITDPVSGRSIDVWQDRGLMHVFTADTVTRPRQSVALEPVEVMTNSLNRPEQADAIRLEPGERRSFRFGATISMETP